MKITFELENEQKVKIFLDGKQVGHIFTPSGSGHDTNNAIQICGFEEAFDYWGCALFGEKLPNKEEWIAIPKEAPIYTQNEEWIKRMTDLAGPGNYKFENGSYYRKEVTPQFRMKKDIQLLFTPFENDSQRYPGFLSRGCEWRCYSNPCICHNPHSTEHALDLGPTNPFNVKRWHELKDLIDEGPVDKEKQKVSKITFKLYEKLTDIEKAAMKAQGSTVETGYVKITESVG